jgi:putative membrane protein
VLRSIVASPVARPVIPGGLATLTVILVVFSVWHAVRTLGARLTLAFFAITAATSWVFEEVGVASGHVYGPYHYTAALGPWLGSVPILIPLAWFMMIYPSYMAANLILDRRAVGTPGTRAHLVGLALLGALVMTAWDLLADPIFSGPTFRAWVWEQGGPYFGVPIQNYLGWVVTAFVVFVLYRSLERRWELRPARPLSTAASGMPCGAALMRLRGDKGTSDEPRPTPVS